MINVKKTNKLKLTAAALVPAPLLAMSENSQAALNSNIAGGLTTLQTDALALVDLYPINLKVPG